MHAIIIDTSFDIDGKKIASYPLSNGETVLERQIRILEICGIREFILVGDRQEQIDPLQKNRRADTKITSVAGFDRLVNPGPEDGVLILQSDLAFTEDVAKRLIESDIPCQTLLSKKPDIAFSAVKAEIDMKRIIRIGKSLEGIGCFPHFPFYKLDRNSFARLAAAFGGEEMPLFEAAGLLLPDLNLQFIDCIDKNGYIGMLNPESFQYVDQQIRLYDFLSQRILRGEGSILSIGEILNENGARKPLLVCDEEFEALPLSGYLDSTQLPCVKFVVSSAPAYDEISEGARMFKREGCDIIISAGRSSTINAAKAIKLFSALDPEKDYFDQDYKYSPIKHIAIPAAAGTGSESTRFAEVRRNNSVRIISHDSILPEYAVLDDLMLRACEKSHPADKNNASNEALAEIRNSMLAYLENGQAVPESMLDVANFIGRAINIAGDEAAYTLGRALSDTCSIPFERAFALCLPFVWARMNGAVTHYRSIHMDPNEQNTGDSIQMEKLEFALNETKQFLGVRQDCELNALLLEIYAFSGLSCPVKKDAYNADLLVKAAGGSVSGGLIAFEEKDIRSVYGQILKLRATAKRPESVKPQPSAKEGRKDSKKKLLKSALQYAMRKTLFRYYQLRHAVHYRTVVFESFAAQNYACNLKAMYEHMLQDDAYSDFKFIWAFREPANFQFLTKNRNTRVVKRNSRAYLKAYARAKYWMTNSMIPTYLTPSRDQVYIHTWHGKPIKRIGCDIGVDNASGRGIKEYFKIYTRMSKKLSILFSPSPAFTPCMSSAFNLKAAKKEHILVETGYPRNDFLFSYTDADVLRIKLRLGIPLNKKVVLYAPTWRPTEYKRGTGYIYHDRLNFARLKEQLGDEYIVLFRAHINEAKSVDFSELSSFMLDVTRVPDVNELYIISDLMISDYSGTIFDYANLRRPMVFYMYDREEYTNNLTGVYFDLDELPGKIVYKEADLAPAIKEQLANFTYDNKYRAFNEKFNCFDGPDCTARALKVCIDLDAPPSQKHKLRSFIMRSLRNFDAQFLGLFRGFGLPPTKNQKALASYRNKHKGHRCFLIGNGPSLTIADLNKLEGEICFACNLIYKIFDSTNWRPTYYCVTDTVFTKTISHEMAEVIDMPMLVSNRAYEAMKERPKNTVYVHCANKEVYYVHGNPLQYYVPAKATVMSFMIEMAMYMGFSEIYLLGVDCSNSFVSAGHFTDDYENKDMMAIENSRAKRVVAGKQLTIEELGKFRQDRSMFAYSRIREYADKNGYHIYNATRGGLLEEFERVSFDNVITEEYSVMSAENKSSIQSGRSLSA